MKLSNTDILEIPSAQWYQALMNIWLKHINFAHHQISLLKSENGCTSQWSYSYKCSGCFISARAIIWCPGARVLRDYCAYSRLVWSTNSNKSVQSNLARWPCRSESLTPLGSVIIKDVKTEFFSKPVIVLWELVFYWQSKWLLLWECTVLNSVT